MVLSENQEYKVLTSVDEISSFVSSNEKTLSFLKNSSVFLTYDFILTWLKHYSSCVYSIEFIVFYEEDRVVGVAPLYIKQAQNFELRFICTGENEEDEVFSERLDFIVADEFEDSVVSIFMKYLDDRDKIWSKIIINNYMEDSFINKYLFPVLLRFKYSVYSHREGFRYTLDLPESSDEFFKVKKGSFYNGLKRKSRQLKKLDGFSCYVVSDQSELEKNMDDIKILHNNRWNRSEIRGAFESDVYFEFHKELAGRLLKNDQLFLLVVKINDSVISVVYGFIFNEVLSFYQSGYTVTQYSKLSIGSVSHLLAIDIAINKKLKTYDFMFGSDDSYKNKFKCVTENMCRCEIYKPGISGKMKIFLDKMHIHVN